MRLLGNDPDLGAATRRRPARLPGAGLHHRRDRPIRRRFQPSCGPLGLAARRGRQPGAGSVGRTPAVVVPEPEPLADAVEQDPVDGDSVPAPADPALVEPAPWLIRTSRPCSSTPPTTPATGVCRRSGHSRGAVARSVRMGLRRCPATRNHRPGRPVAICSNHRLPPPRTRRRCRGSFTTIRHRTSR